MMNVREDRLLLLSLFTIQNLGRMMKYDSIINDEPKDSYFGLLFIIHNASFLREGDL